MMAMKVTSRDKDIIRLDGDGCIAVLRLGKTTATLIYLHIPEDDLAGSTRAQCLSYIESAAALAGVKKLIYEFQEDEELIGLFKRSDYEIKKAGEMISFAAADILDSEAVKKTLRMKIPVFRSAIFEELFAFQKDELSGFLRQLHFPMENDDLGRFDDRLSIVSYDESYQPHAMILTTKWDEGYLVDLLIGFSKTKPQYTLSVCQEFARMLEELSMEQDPGRIFVYSCEDFVKALILRFLDKKYELRIEYPVMRAVKNLSVSNNDVSDSPEESVSLENWQEEIDRLPGRRNISDKSFWLADKRG